MRPAIIYIYLCGRLHSSRLSYFSNRTFGVEQKLNLNITQALEKSYRIVIFHIDSWYIVPISINTFGVRNQTESLSGYKLLRTVPYISPLNGVGLCRLERGVWKLGIQQENSRRSKVSQIYFLQQQHMAD